MTVFRKNFAAGLALAGALGLAALLLGRALPAPEGGPSWLSAERAGWLISPAWASGGEPPVVDAGLDRRAAPGDTVVLDASGSSHPEGEEISLGWAFFSKPTASGATILDADTLKPSFTVDVGGAYVIELTVSDGFGASASDWVTISTDNVAPVADAGPDQTVDLGGNVRLDASASFDVDAQDGERLSFAWSLDSKPAGSLAEIDEDTALMPSFTADVAGEYMLSLTASDDMLTSDPDTLRISTSDSHPVAEAGPDQKVAVDQTVILRLEGLFDADGELLEERDWSIILRPPDSTADFLPNKNRRFIVDEPGTYLVQRTAAEESGGDDDDDGVMSNGGSVSATDTVILTTDGNLRPVADAGADQSVALDDTVSLRGAGSSDVDGDRLAYRWALTTVPAGSLAEIDDPAAVNPTFEADEPGTYVAQLTVADAAEASVPDTVVITTGNSRPVADAGPDQQEPKKNTITLDGSGSSDADFDTLSFDWALVKRPSASSATLNDPDTEDPTFYTDTGKRFVAQLTVRDGTLASAPDNVVVGPGNMRPVAEAGADQEVLLGETVQLDGSGSSDAADDPLTYQWALLAVPEDSEAELSDATAVDPSFVADLPGIYVAQLLVTDDNAAPLVSDPDTVVITINNQPPVADAGSVQTVDVGTPATLDGSASSDADGDLLTFAWTIIAAPTGSVATLSNPAAQAPTLTPDVEGDYIVELVVNDGFADSAPDTVTVTAEQVVAANQPPVLEPVGDQPVDLGSTLSLTLEASDPDGDTLAFTATPLPLPEGASLNGATGAFSFTPSAAQVGDIALTFVVSDGVLTDSETVVITVDGAPPTGGQTALTGRLLDANDFVNGVETPIIGATVSILESGVSVESDANGDFMLSGVPAGTQVFDIDASTAGTAPDGSSYAGFREALDLIADVTNEVDRPFFLPRIEEESLTTVDPATTTVVENERLGVILEISPFSAKNPDGSDFTGQISISEVPAGLAPAELPDFLDPGLLVTIQPVGVVFNPPAAITFPNIDDVPPGDIIQIWSLDPDRGTFDVTGIGEATADGASTVTIAGGIRRADWHGPFPPQPGPGDGEDNNDDNQNDDDECTECEGNSSVALHSGNLSETHELASYRSLGQSRALTLKYNSTTADPQPIVSSSTTILRRGSVPTTISGRIEVAGIDQGIEVFTSTSDPAPLNENLDERLRQVLQFDAGGLETGVYPYRFVSSNNYAATRIAGATTGRVLVDNRIDSPFGAGWDLDGLDRLKLQDSEGLLLRGDGAILRFGNFLPEATTEEIIPDILDFPIEPGRDLQSEGVFIDVDENLSPPADYNGDGITDFAITVTPAMEIEGGEGLPFGFTFTEIFLGDGEGNFPSSRTLQTSDTLVPCPEGCVPDTRAAVPGEFNGDGILDLVVVNFLSDEVRVFPGLTAGFYGSPASAPVTDLGRELAVADFDGDGNQDAVVGNFSSTSPVVTVLFGDGTGALPTQVEFSGLTDGLITELIPADLNGDGATDLVIGRNVVQGGARRVSMALNDGSGNLVATTGAFSGFTLDEFIAPTDVDGDGDLDLVGQSGNTLQYFWNDGAGTFDRDVEGRVNSAVISDATLPGSGFGSEFDLRDGGDIDDDGDADFLVIYQQSFSDNRLIVLYFNDGTGALPGRVFADTGSRAFIRDATFDDINGDELVDVFTRRTQLATTFLVALPEPASGPGIGSFSTPAADFSTLVRNFDGSFTRTMKDGTRHEFDADGFMTALVDRNENTTSHTFDSQGRLIKITDPVGLETTLTYAGGRLSGITDPANRTTLFEHDGDGNLTKITDPDGSLREFAYDARHRLVSQLSKRGFEATYDYGFQGRVIRANRPDGSTNEYEISQDFGLVDSASGAGTEANPAPYVRPEDRVATFTDGNGNETTYGLNRFGGTSIIVDALGRVTDTGRNEDNNATRITQPNGRVDEVTYDERGNLLVIREAVGNSLERQTTFEYDTVFSQTTRIVDPEQQTVATRGDTRFEYDVSGNLIKIINAELTETVFAYGDSNCPGLATSVTAASGLPEEATTSFDYDPVTCNPLTVSDPLLNLTTFEYDAAGNVTKITDADLHETRFVYDSLNRVTKQIGATNLDPNPACGTAGVTCLTYDSSGNLSTLTDANDNTTSFEYDSRERLATQIDPLLNQEAVVYNGNGNPRFTIDRKGQTTEFRYDAANRLTQKIMLPGTLNETSRAFDYDFMNNVLSIVDTDSALTMTYDVLDRLKTASTASAPVQPDVLLAFNYDRNNNRLTMDDGLVGVTSYDYDALNRRDLQTNPALQVADFEYDALGRRSSVALPNGVSANLGYDLAGRLTSLVNSVNTTIISSFAYTHNSVGNRETLTQTRAAITVASPLNYVYDELNQIQSATHPLPASPAESFAYDPAGNRLSRDGQVIDNVIGAGNQLLEDEQFCYGYDLNGNLASKTAKVAGACIGGVTVFSFDPENRLRRIDFPSSGSFAVYRYDGLGRRIEKNVDGQITRYLYDAEDILFEFDDIGALLARYTHGPGFDDPLILERDENANGILEGSEAFVYHRDSLGSVVQLTDVNGAVARAYAYDTFGQIAAEIGTLENPYTFTSREFDTESGLYYHRARYYDAEIGRFINEDHIGFLAGDVNLFRYVFANPVNFADPTGEILPLLALGCAAGGAAGVFESVLAAETEQLIDDLLGDESNGNNASNGSSSCDDGSSSDGSGNGMNDGGNPDPFSDPRINVVDDPLFPGAVTGALAGCVGGMLAVSAAVALGVTAGASVTAASLVAAEGATILPIIGGVAGIVRGGSMGLLF